MIRKACLKDIHAIMEIVKKTVEIMKSEDNPQWDENYPIEIDFIDDIRSDSLFLYEYNGVIEGMVCINCVEPAEYESIGWFKNQSSTVIHRMAVLPQNRGKGIGYSLVAFADEIARQNNTFYLKSDTYGINIKMNALMQKHGYILRGQMNFKGKPGKFNCYDKELLL